MSFPQSFRQVAVCKPVHTNRHSVAKIETNLRQHVTALATSPYTKVEVGIVLHNIAVKIQEIVHDTTFEFKVVGNVHTSGSGITKTLTYRFSVDSREYTVEFQLVFCNAPCNLKTLGKAVHSFRVQGCTIRKSPKSGLHVIHKSNNYHIYHKSTTDLSVESCPEITDLESFILGYFSLLQHWSRLEQK